ncbi:uncharacterized protein LOC116230308 [Phasianus colchicus]|uniref:uncharacterized protein LOC116230308 n=1 Tax=Phasianus colchicus TaxID=9054 RepID=UPI00129D48F2|nr:uncharacterized protein LOC116230308 [Phasianus colchicus]
MQERRKYLRSDRMAWWQWDKAQSCSGGRAELSFSCSQFVSFQSLCLQQRLKAATPGPAVSPVFSPCRSLDRKLQRPLLGKSRTLPSIPQSPVLSRIPLLDSAAFREAMPEQKPYQKHSAPDGQKGCTVPSAGDAWRLEDDGMDPPGDAPLQPQLRTAVEDAPFSHFRMRSFYMRKSLSVDNHLGSLGYAVHPAETKAERVRTRLRRQFVSTWGDATHSRGFAKHWHGRGLAVCVYDKTKDTSLSILMLLILPTPAMLGRFCGSQSQHCHWVGLLLLTRQCTSGQNKKGLKAKRGGHCSASNTQHLGLSKGSGLQGCREQPPAPGAAVLPLLCGCCALPTQCLMGSASSLSHRHLIQGFVWPPSHLVTGLGL